MRKFKPHATHPQAPPRVQPADPMKWIPVVEEDNNKRGEPKKGPRQQSPLIFTKADFENEEDVDFGGEGNIDALARGKGEQT